MQYRTLNTGDQIWVRKTEDGRELVSKFITHDGLTWAEGEASFTQLTGAERFFHRLVVAAIRANHFIMS